MRCTRYPPSSQPRQRGVGRPGSQFSSKDVVFVPFGTERTPTKAVKTELERCGQVISCFDVNREWKVAELQEELKKLLPSKMVGLPFEVVKNCAGVLIQPNLPSGREIDGTVLYKSISPTGAIYVRLLEEVYEEFDDDEIFNTAVFRSDIKNVDDVVNLSDGDNGCNNKVAPEVESGFDVVRIVQKAKEKHWINPTELLLFLQEEIVTDRKLDISDLETDDNVDGETNYITVDRDNILATTFSELKYVDEFRKTIQVNFMGEESCDLGGPRKEWIRLVLQQIYEKYFKHGLRQFLSKDYYYVGIMYGIALLQNGQMPNFVEESILQEIFACQPPSV